MQFARNVQFQIKKEKRQDFRQLFEREVIPILRKQDGFVDELALVSENRAMGISLWKDRNAAERYQNATYPEVLKKLQPVIDGTPNVETYEVAATTLTS